MKRFRLVLYLYILLASTVLVAGEIYVKIDNDKPVVGEPFHLFVQFQGEISDRPETEFNPNKLLVTKRERTENDYRSIYKDGKIVSVASVVYKYTLYSETAGRHVIKDIKVRLGNKEFAAKPISLMASSKPIAPKDFFALTEVSKDQAFVGEGISVKYYFYRHVPGVRAEVAEFPQFKKFTKRYINSPNKIERVKYSGVMYERTLMYELKLFPEKIGSSYVSPLMLNVHVQQIVYGKTYGDDHSNIGPFGEFFEGTFIEHFGHDYKGIDKYDKQEKIP